MAAERTPGGLRAKPAVAHVTGDTQPLHSNAANYINLNAGNRLNSSCFPPVNIVSRGRQTESLWARNYGRRGMELGAEPSVY